jgi:hypothetical protein
MADIMRPTAKETCKMAKRIKGPREAHVGTSRSHLEKGGKLGDTDDEPDDQKAIIALVSGSASQFY